MNKHYTIGVDIGASKIEAGLVRGDKILKKFRLATESTKRKGANGILMNVRDSIREVWDPKVKRIGIGMAGTTDPKRGFFFRGANFPRSFRNIHIAQRLKGFKVPVMIDNDVHCFTLGEALYGVAKGKKYVFGMTLGTGLGGGLIIDGQIYRGRDNAAGEIGHTTIAMNTEKAICGMGLTGHLEAFASGTGMARMISERYRKPFPTEELSARAKTGDRKAQEIIDIAGHAFAIGCANVVQTLNPDTIVVGGGLSRMQGLWKVLRREFKGLIPYRQLRSTEVIKSKLGHDANILGGANLV
ncbi:MAG: ROK family protein [Patescibacteria group bacterium]|nr:ROK family protein [Patescibacteria group bacterium]